MAVDSGGCMIETCEDRRRDRRDPSPDERRKLVARARSGVDGSVRLGAAG